MLTHFYLIRHGETDWNKLGKIQGHTDIPLNRTGVNQAESVAQRLAQVPLDFVCSSDLSRAIKTAEAIKKFHPEVPLMIYPEFRERNYGRWEGMTAEEIAKLTAQNAQKNERLAGIETLEEMQQRGLLRLEQLSQMYPTHHIAVVSHGGFINALLHLMSRGEHGTGITKLGNTAFNYITRNDHEWMIQTINDTSHLVI
jgi:broad specificity phosphatase PhoE